MIEKVQKQFIFEEAARNGIMNSQILQIPEILQNLLGVTDIGQQKYGFPLTPLYKAVNNELIEIPKMASYFKGLSRDIKVGTASITNLENDLLLFNLEMWTRMQLLKNKSNELSKKAKVEKLRAALGATWVYTESFSNTRFLDMQNTTAWIDTSEGVVTIPNLGNEKTVPMHEIQVTETQIPSTANLVGSNPKQAADGLDSTNWRCSFITDEWVSATYNISSSDLTAITIDPVGFGIELKVEVNSMEGFREVVKAIIYSKKTFPIDQKQTKQVRISFKPATSVLPKVVGIREFVLYQTISSRYAEIYTTRLKPNEAFTELKIQTKGEIPNATKITSFFRTTTGGAWTEIKNGDWHPIVETDTAALSVSFTEAVEGTSSASFRGLYAKALNYSGIPITTTEGSMEIGLNMVEVTAFKKDWTESGEFPRILTLSDFDNQMTKRTWSNVGLKSFTAGSAGSGTCVQFSTDTTISSDATLIKGGDFMLFQRKLNSDDFSTDISSYNQLCIVPLVGVKSTGAMQYQYNYKLSFNVFCPKAFSYQNAKYWFYQGYRKSGRRSYKDIVKSFGTFSLYINKTLVAAENTGNTVYDDNTLENLSDVDLGKAFSYNFNSGWNRVEILMNVFDPEGYGPDDFDVANKPFVQLSLYPSLFDQTFSQNKDTYISRILASGIHKPINEFDLLWNTPKEPTFWSWSNDRRYLFFNTNQLKNIDGYYSGTAPLSVISYKSIQSDNVDDLYIKLILEKEDSQTMSPILDEMNVMTR